MRVFFLGQLPGDWAFSIAGQLSWVNLLYEVISEAIILPLFFFIGSVKEDKTAFSNRLRTGMLVSFGVHTVVSAAVFLFAEQLLVLMAADKTIIAASAEYIRIESIANIFACLAQFALVALISVNRSRCKCRMGLQCTRGLGVSANAHRKGRRLGSCSRPELQGRKRTYQCRLSQVRFSAVCRSWLEDGAAPEKLDAIAKRVRALGVECSVAY